MNVWAFLAGSSIATLGACVSLNDSAESTNEKEAGAGGDASVINDGAFPTGGTGGASGAAGASSGGGGTAGASAGSGGGSGGGPVWKLYSRAQAFPTQWNVAPLSAAWSGANAPPVFGIEAATQLLRFDALVVFDDQGRVYVRADKVWRPPATVAQTFSGWTYGQVLAAEHQMSAPGETKSDLVVLLGANGRACVYDYVSSNATFQFSTCLTLPDGDGGVWPPRMSVPVEWSVDIWNDSLYGTAEYVQVFVKYAEYAYLFDATPAFTNKWLVQNSPLWAGTSNPPPTTGLKAGYYDPVGAVVYLIGP